MRRAVHGANKAAVARNRVAKMKNKKEKKEKLVFGLF
jgi:hypothetical protein